jgi:hypothetical protein
MTMTITEAIAIFNKPLCILPFNIENCCIANIPVTIFKNKELFLKGLGFKV